MTQPTRLPPALSPLLSVVGELATVVVKDAFIVTNHVALVKRRLDVATRD